MSNTLNLTCPINDTMTKEQKYEALRVWEIVDLNVPVTKEYAKAVLLPIMDYMMEEPGVREIMENTADVDVLARIFFEPNLPLADLEWIGLEKKHYDFFCKEVGAITGSPEDGAKILSALREWDTIETISYMATLGMFNKQEWLDRNGDADDPKYKDLRKEVELLF